MWKMERNTNNILDIHTHKAESVSAGKAIINRKLATDALCEGYFYSAGIHPWDLTEFDTERRFFGSNLQKNSWWPWVRPDWISWLLLRCSFK
jgi:hypothetical protein